MDEVDLAAPIAATMFRVAYERWVSASEDAALSLPLRDVVLTTARRMTRAGRGLHPAVD